MDYSNTIYSSRSFAEAYSNMDRLLGEVYVLHLANGHV